VLTRLKRRIWDEREKLLNRRFHWTSRRLRKRYSLPEVRLSSAIENIDLQQAPIMDSICLPPYKGSAQADDFGTLFRLAHFLQPKVVLELGTAHGNTVANMCRALPEARILTVNAPAQEQTGRITTYTLDESEIGCVYRNHGYASRVRQILANTLRLDLAEHLDGRRVDLAIIDACHDTSYVLNDFSRVRPFMSETGVVLFHDTHPITGYHLETSYVACMILRRQGLDVRHIANTWWGIWTPGNLQSMISMDVVPQ
jgi:predicted O-methyltransferase YrrM